MPTRVFLNQVALGGVEEADRTVCGASEEILGAGGGVGEGVDLSCEVALLAGRFIGGGFVGSWHTIVAGEGAQLCDGEGSNFREAHCLC